MKIENSNKTCGGVYIIAPLAADFLKKLSQIFAIEILCFPKRHVLDEVRKP